VIGILNTEATFTITGRSGDSQWLQVTFADGLVGWIAIRFARGVNRAALDPAAVAALPVMAEAVEASPTPTSAFLAGVPSWLTGISARSRQIYLQGQQLGNRRGVFSKIGDSITASAQFMYPFGNGQYNLGAYGGLGYVVGSFAGFNRESLAAGNGWTTESLLAIGGCGEAVVICELKTNKPSVALIMIGTNDSGSGDVGVFTNNLQQIVQFSIDLGVIPVLSTIPPKVFDEAQRLRVDSYNSAILTVARQFDIPLWDYHSQMVNAPNMGISSDGLHPSVPAAGGGDLSAAGLQFGYAIRNLNALYVLDSMLRYIMY
jgi:lysophospholipase L1-like esterase